MMVSIRSRIMGRHRAVKTPGPSPATKLPSSCCRRPCASPRAAELASLMPTKRRCISSLLYAARFTDPYRCVHNLASVIDSGASAAGDGSASSWDGINRETDISSLSSVFPRRELNLDIFGKRPLTAQGEAVMWGLKLNRSQEVG